MQDLTRKMAKGAAWMVLLRLAHRSIGFVSTIILARLLVPADFGLVSIAAAILAGLQLLGSFSFDMALIQNQNAERSHYDTVWTIGLLFAALFAVALVALAHPAALFFNEPRLAGVMQVLALGTLVNGFTNVGVVAFRKEMQFDKEFKFTLVTRIIPFVVTVTLAFLWRDYWALVLGTLTGMVMGTLISYAAHPYRPRFSLAAWGELFNFSRWLFFNNTLGFLYSKAADFMVAKGIGPEGLGYYNVAYEISNLPSSELVMPINRAVFPGYAKMSSAVNAIRQGYINVISMLFLLALPAAVGLSCIAAPMVDLILGPKWISIIPLIPVLAMHGLLTAIMSCGNYTFVALGKPRFVTLLLAVHLCMAIPMIGWGAFHGDINAVAWALLIASVLLVPLNYYLLSVALKIRPADLMKVFWRPIAAAIIMAALLTHVQGLMIFESGIGGKIGTLLILVAVGALIYCGIVMVLWRLVKCPDGAERFIWDQIVVRLRFSS